MIKKKNTIWITGASSGIGRSLAIAYGKDPVNLILSARNKDRLEKVKKEIGEPERIRILPLDLTDIESFPRIVEQAWGMFDGVDIMIHNGGISQRSLVAETALSVDRSIFETNYFGTIGLTKCLLPYFSKRQSGY
jgi:short-subunit dehydrogenase